MSARRPHISLLLAIVAAMSSADVAIAGDWTYWRGPSMNGVSPETGLPSEWDPRGGEGSNVLWKRDDLGTRSSPVVMDGRVYFLARHNPETSQEQEKVVCLDAKTGETVWESIFNLFLTDVPDTRVAWSSVVADPDSQQVYALGVGGVFQCLKADTGETVWKKSLSEEFGLLSTYGGRTNMPIVVDDNVIISAVIIGWGEMAKPSHRFLAFEKNTGMLRWFESTRLLPDDTTYSGPLLTQFGSRPAIVFGAGDGGVYAFEPLTGREIWKTDISTRGINTTPTVDHATGRVFCGHSEENVGSTEMGALFAVDGNRTGDLSDDRLWTKQGLFCGKSAPLVVGNRLYAIDDRAKLHVVDPETGDTLSDLRMGTMQRMSPVYADGKIYTGEANGRIYVLQPDGDEAKFLSKGRLPRGEECHGSPAVAGGCLFWPTTGAMYCIGTGDGAAATVESLLTLPNIRFEASDETPTQAQLVPGEALISPGEDINYTVRLFSEDGLFVREAAADEVELSVESLGTTDVDNDDDEARPTVDGLTLTTDQSGFEAVAVTASVKGTDLTATGRVRIEPKLDWTFDFDDLQVPTPFVGAAYRMVALDGDLIDELRGSDPVAADLYIYLSSSLINSGAPKLTYDDSTPAQKWSDLLRFFDLDAGADRPSNLEDAKARFDSPLQTLVGKGVLGGYEWSTWQRTEDSRERTRLTVMAPQSTPKAGNGVLTKIRTIPKGTRSQSWMGSPDLSDYTIQADVKGFSRNGKQPDIGLIAQRYTLDLMGASQQLQIRTWTPQLYKAEQTPVSWSPNTWYTLKFKAAMEGDEAVLRGKVWPRDEDEPADWQVVVRDGEPNRTGSPGLFGNAKDAEIFYDNIRVTAND